MTQQMFKYDDKTYRFISDSPIKVGDKVYLLYSTKAYEVLKVTKVSQDKGNWKRDGKPVVIYSNTVII